MSIVLTPGPQVAAAEATEHCGSTSIPSLALQRVEDLLDGVRHGRSADRRRVTCRVGDARFREPATAELAGVAAAAGEAVGRRVVAAQRERVVDAEGKSELDDLSLGEVQQRRLDANRKRSLHAALRGE